MHERVVAGRYVFDANGELVGLDAQGVAWQVRLPDGQLFHAAGHADWLTETWHGSPGKEDDTALCAALA